MEWFSSVNVMQILHCFGELILYLIPCVLILLPVRFFTKIPSFIFRKLLHIVAFSGLTVMLLAAANWQSAAITSVLIAVIIYPLLALLEKYSWYSSLFVEKKPGEIKMSLLLLFFMFAAVIAVAWGMYAKPHTAAASILMWGVGDAAAALVGIPFGRHKVSFPPVRGRKSWEGSGAMLAAGALTGICLLCVCFGYPVRIVPGVLAGAFAGAVTELLSPTELDTVTVPLTVMIILLVLL